MKTFTMNLDFLGYKPSVGHVKSLKILVSRGLRNRYDFFVELNFHKKVQCRDKFEEADDALAQVRGSPGQNF